MTRRSAQDRARAAMQRIATDAQLEAMAARAKAAAATPEPPFCQRCWSELATILCGTRCRCGRVCVDVIGSESGIRARWVQA